jgi:Ca-activated chloride channel homolog
MFAHPSLLLLLLIIPLALLFFVWRTRVRQARLRRLGDDDLINDLSTQVDQSRRRWKSGLWLLTVAAVVVAIARPVWGIAEDTIRTRGVSLVVALDVSKSMDAQDVSPSRIERAKLTARELFVNGRGNEVGLILFAGTAFVQFPLTADTFSAQTFLNAASTDSISRQGTALEDALWVALEAFDDRIAAHSVIVLLTDGENHEGEPLRAAEEAAQRGITIHVIGYGGSEGEPIPVFDADGQIVEHKTNSTGDVILSRLDESILRQIAETTGGLYQRANNSGIEAVNLLNELLDLQETSPQNYSQEHKVERFGLFVAVALLALSIEMVISERREIVV